MANRKTVLKIEGASPVADDPIAAPEDQHEDVAPETVTAPAQEDTPASTDAKADEHKASHPKVRTEVLTEQPEPAAEAASVPAKKTAKKTQKASAATGAAHAATTSSAEAQDGSTGRSFLHSPLAWVERHFPGRVNAVLGGMVGLVLALMVFAIGFWKTLFVALFVLVGVALGQYLDGDPKIIDFLRRIVSATRGDGQS